MDCDGAAPLIVPAPRRVVVAAGAHAGDPRGARFACATLELESSELEPWREILEEWMRQDGLEVRPPQPPPSPTPPRSVEEGDRCVRVRVRCRPGAHASDEFYVLECSREDGASVEGCSPRACLWGVQTLRQVLRQTRGGFAGRLRVEDFPVFETRGVLLDISRDRVPQLGFVKRLVRLLSAVKVNHLQLYMEHTFAYEGHEAVWATASPFTAEDVQELDRFCALHGVTLVPCQNTLGHMSRWLSRPEYNALAEVPAGVVHPFSPDTEPFSLCPSDERSWALVEGLLGQLLPHFGTNMAGSRPLVNVNLDEAFDLGRAGGRTSGPAGPALAKYASTMEALVRGLGAHMVMWADGVDCRNLVSIPADVTLVEWGYEADHSWAARVGELRRHGHRVFVAPGTSSWCSIAGRTDNAQRNLRQAALHGAAAGASGFIVADWGDYGHHQQPCVSYLGYLTGAVHAWSPAHHERGPTMADLQAWANLTGLFGTPALTAAAFRLGNVYKLLPTPPNMSLLWLVLAVPHPLQDNHLVRFAIETLAGLPYPRSLLRSLGPAFGWVMRNAVLRRQRLDRVEAEVRAVLSDCLPADDAVFDMQGRAVAQQLRFTADLLLLAVDVWRERLSKGIHRAATECEFDHARVALVVERFQALWLSTSREGGMQDSTNKLRAMVGGGG